MNENSIPPTKLVITNTFPLVVNGLDNRWILRITGAGKVELNPEVPQDVAVTRFVQICSDLLTRSVATKTGKEPADAP